MLRAQPDSAAVAVSGSLFERALVGSWTLDLNPPAQKNVLPSGPGAQSFEPKLIDSARRGTLILVWNLQS